MTERNLIIGGVIILIFVAAIGGGIAKYNETANASPSPAPRDELLFGNNQQQQGGQQQRPGQAQQQQQRMIKQYPSAPAVLPSAELTNKKVVITTGKGVIEFEILPEAPKAASNFIFLAKDGFYNGLTFHRVEPGFVIQGGDPVGNGTGGPGYRFEDEPVSLNYDKGIVAMANAGPNTNGSQFFIMLEDNPTLPKNYTIFGRVIKGQEVVDSIAKGDVMQTVVVSELQ